MQFVVIGAGSLGCVYGANLARIGEAVAFLDVWAEHVAEIAERGVALSGLTGDFRIRAQAALEPAKLPRADIAVICVNAYSTAEAAAAAKRVLKPDGYCLTLQNGVGNVEILSDALGAERVLAGLSFQSGDLEAPGRARHTNNGPTYVGELAGAMSPRLERLVALLREAGMNPVPQDDIVLTIWEKFVHNCGINAICAITALRPSDLQHVPGLMEFQERIIAETLALLDAKGVRLREADPARAIREYCAHKSHRPSMLQHLERGRRTEIDALNGYVARESRILGLSAPANEALTALIRGRERGVAGNVS